MKLQHGKLYEAADGHRYRVTFNPSLQVFECKASYNGSWDEEGQEIRGSYNLVKEVEEFRWVPVTQENTMNPDGFYRIHRGHLQKQVPRSDLVKPKIPESPLPDSGVVYTVFGPLHWKAKRNERNIPTFVISTLKQTKMVKA